MASVLASRSNSSCISCMTRRMSADVAVSRKYGPGRLESACERALAAGAATYKSVKSILAHALDAQPLIRESSGRPAEHKNIRGAGYYQ